MRAATTWFCTSLLLFGASPSSAQEATIHFSRLGQDDGLSQVSVTSIAQDALGYLWFGTQDGLNRFDGYTFDVYHSAPENPGSLSNDYVLSMLTDSHGILWIGTYEGLYRYDTRTDVFTLIRISAVGPEYGGGAPTESLAARGSDPLTVTWTILKPGCISRGTSHSGPTQRSLTGSARTA